MEKYKILLGYFDKQVSLIRKLHRELVDVDISVYEKQFLFAMKSQQFYTAIEDLFKQIAKAFENHIEDLGSFHRELLIRMNTEIPKTRPSVISNQTLSFLDKLRAFRHFIRHAYDCELDEKELLIIQEKLRKEYKNFEGELEKFRRYIAQLSERS